MFRMYMGIMTECVSGWRCCLVFLKLYSLIVFYGNLEVWWWFDVQHFASSVAFFRGEMAEKYSSGKSEI